MLLEARNCEKERKGVCCIANDPTPVTLITNDVSASRVGRPHRRPLRCATVSAPYQMVAG